MRLAHFLGFTLMGRAIVGALAAALVVGFVVIPRFSAGTPAPQLRTQAVTRANVTQTIALSGSITADQVRLSFRSPGRLAEITAKVGDAVSKGQVLARLDTTDLATAVKQAQANVLSAQAKYDSTVSGASAEDIALARNALASATTSAEQAQKNAQNDLTTAQRSLDQAARDLDQATQTGQTDVDNAYLALQRLRASYATARANVSGIVADLKEELTTYGARLTSARASLGTALDATDEILQTSDTTAARDSLNSADLALVSAQRSTSGVAAEALDDFAAAVNELLAAAGDFDSAVASSSDPQPSVTRYQNAGYAYQLASARLGSALDLPAGQVSSALSSASSALNSFDALTSQDRFVLDQARVPTVAAQNALIADQQSMGTMKTKLSQATSSVGTIGDAVTGSLLSAQTAYANAQTKRDTSLRSAKDTLISAQQSLGTTQDKAGATTSSQQIALENAKIQFEKSTATPKSTDIALALASLQLAQIALDKATADLDAATLRAPAAGLIASVASQVGETPASPFIVIAITSRLTLHGTVGESEVAKLKSALVATVVVDAVSATERLTGRVTSIDPIATISQGVPVYGVDVVIDVPDPAVRAGMTATATVIIASKQGVLTVPNTAIRTTGGIRMLQVLRDGKAEDAQVTLGISNDTITEVVSGLEEGDLVVLPQPRTTTTTNQQRAPGGFGGGGGGPVIVNR